MFWKWEAWSHVILWKYLRFTNRKWNSFWFLLLIFLLFESSFMWEYYTVLHKFNLVKWQDRRPVKSCQRTIRGPKPSKNKFNSLWKKLKIKFKNLLPCCIRVLRKYLLSKNFDCPLPRLLVNVCLLWCGVVRQIAGHESPRPVVRENTIACTWQ